MSVTADNEHRLPRSPELMSRGDTALLVVDVQEKLVAGDGRRRTRRLERAAADRRGEDPWPAGRWHRAVSERVGANGGRTGRAAGPAAVEARLQLRRLSRIVRKSARPAAFTKSWSAGSKPTSASSNRCWTCWPTGGGCTWRPMPSARGSKWTAASPWGGWIPPAPRSPPPRQRCSSGAQTAGTPEFKEISRLAREPGP